MIEPGQPSISVRRQCKLLGLSRSSYYREAVGESEENLGLMRLIDEEYTRHPFYLWVQEDEEVSERTGVQSEPKEDSEADEINGPVINSSEETDNGTW